MRDPGDYDDEPDDDGYQQYKDDLAMGYINEDGSQREPPEPDWSALAQQEHEAEAHDGQPCDCPKPDPDVAASQWDAFMAQHQADVHGGGVCTCPQYNEPPF